MTLPGAVARAGDDLTVAKETTAGQVTWAIREHHQSHTTQACEIAVLDRLYKTTSYVLTSTLIEMAHR